MAAARHALTTVGAAVSLWPHSPKKRVCRALTGAIAKEYANRSWSISRTKTEFLGHLADSSVAFALKWIGDHSEHCFRLPIIRFERLLPICNTHPTTGVEETRRWTVKSVCVYQRAAANTGATHDHHISKQVDSLNARHAQLGKEQEFLYLPGGLREVAIGETVGYANAWTADRPTVIATVSGGYADGLLRSLSGRAVLWDGDTPCPLVGRVSMDLITVDIGHLAQLPEVLDILGPHQRVDDLAAMCDTIGYEILTGLGQRYNRRYLQRAGNGDRA